jgi:transglutaminase-like putative cysteine protease
MRPTAASVTSAATSFLDWTVLAMLLAGFLAVATSGELDLATTVLTASAFLFRALMIAGIIRLQVSQTLTNAITTVIVVFLAADYWLFSRSFAGTTLHFIFVVAAAKLLTAKTPRDYSYLKIIAALEILAASILSRNLSFFLFLTLFVLTAIPALVGGEIVRSLRKAKSVSPASSPLLGSRLGLMSAGLFVGILVMASALFFVLPRTARTAMQQFTPPRHHLPGFGSEVTLGDMGELKRNSTTVMRVRSYTARSLEGLYWRGATLSYFDGSRWSSPFTREERLVVEDDKLLLTPDLGARSGSILGYSVELSDLAPDALFFAGVPQTISVQLPMLFRASSGTIRAPRVGIPVLHYGAYSLLEADGFAPSPQSLSQSDQRDYLQVPVLDPRIVSLARDWAADEKDPLRIARAIVSHFQRDFVYSLDLPSAPARDPLAQFLFERKKGHCEYFASSMAIMLRTLGIPSRIATGFYGGVLNSISGWQVLRASDAHSWVEAWIPKRGWITFDPTPADSTPAHTSQILAKAELWLDAADQFWSDWVLGYDFDHQVRLASRAQTASRMWQFGDWNPWFSTKSLRERFRATWFLIVPLVIVLILAVIYGPAVLVHWKRRQPLIRAQRGEAKASDATLIYERMLELLEAAGSKRPPWLTPDEFAKTLPNPSDVSLLVEDLTTAYNEVRFGGHQDVAPRMAHLLRRLQTLLA